jgi:hypothetical protein
VPSRCPPTRSLLSHCPHRRTQGSNDRLAPDVAWEAWDDSSAQRAGAPHLAARTGPDDVAGYFAVLGTYTVLDFTVLDIIGTGRQTAAEVRASFDLPGGARLTDEEIHLWTFDDEDRVVRFRHYIDAAKHIAAARGEDTTER